jgi:hypothetical protein
MPVKHYRAKPITVQAVEWTGDNLGEIAAFVGNDDLYQPQFAGDELTVATHNGKVTVHLGDYVMIDNAGKPYPCVAHVFHQRWEETSIVHPEANYG